LVEQNHKRAKKCDYTTQVVGKAANKPSAAVAAGSETGVFCLENRLDADADDDK